MADAAKIEGASPAAAGPARTTLRSDLVVVGSGAGGLATAVAAAWLGLEVVVVEKTPQVGGTSAWSGGYLWIPGNPLARAAGVMDDDEASRTYLRHEIGDRYDQSLIEAFLEQGPRMVEFFQAETRVQFINGAGIPDFHGRVPGAAAGNRAIGTAPFNGRELGDQIGLLRPPLDLISPFGMGIASGADIGHFLNLFRKWRSFVHVTRRMARHWADRLQHGRGMHLVNGNALVARLLRSALDLKVRIITGASAQCLLRDGGAVCGVRVCTADGEQDILATRGVVLAAGGFPHDQARKADLFAHAPTGVEHWSAAPPANTGDGLRLAETAGGVVRQDFAAGGGWIPVSLAKRRDGSVGHFPHLIDRAKPGVIMVRADGARFCNEADSYHDIMCALFRATPPGDTVQAWLVCDRSFIRRFGLGRVRPWPLPLRPWVRQGYLLRGRTIEALAAACGIGARGLEQEVQHFNECARSGTDPDFGRGETAFNRAMGDAGHQPNPCLAPICQAPFYAVRVVPGSLSTFAGLRTDPSARVLDGAGQAIPGLYAVGNDMASIGGGAYPAGGFTLGPAMTFAYIAAHHASGVPLENNRTPRAH